MLCRKMKKTLRLAEIRCGKSFLLKRQISVLYFGSDGFSKSCLKSLYNNSQLSDNNKIIDRLGVVCLPDKHDKLPVKIYAKEQNIPISTYPEILNDESHYDIGVVVSFGKLIPKSIIKSFKYGMINVHGSLLPRWRGATPIAHTILSGDVSTGITIMEIVPGKFDHGRILDFSEAIKVKPDWTSEDLALVLEGHASDTLLKCLGDIKTYLKNATYQDTNLVTNAPKFTIDDTFVSWNTQTAEEIYRRYLAYGFKKDFVLQTTFQEKPIKLQKLVRLTEDQLNRASVDNTEPGHVQYDKKSKTVFVRCKESFVGVVKLILSKPINAHDFYNGSIQVLLKQNKKVKFV